MSIEQKQIFLRTEIIERGISTDQFFEYWQTLDLELDDVTLDKLKQVVHMFLQTVPSHQQQIPHQPEEPKEEEEEEFTDFQEAEAEANQTSNEVKHQYADFNWDFLNIKKHHDHPSQEPKEESNSKMKKEEEQTNEVKQTSPKKQQTKKTQKIVQKAEKKKEQIKKLVQRQEKPKPKKQAPNLIQDAIQEPQAFKSELPQSGNPNQQKSVTVKQVLQSSKLNRLKCLKLQQNVLSHHTNVEISVINVEETEDKNANLLNKLIKKTELVFTIKTVARNKNRSIGITWEVKRKTKDFQWLRIMLIKFYPGLVVPPLPTPTTSKEKVFGYQKKLQHFLLDCYRTPELKNSTYYEVFLSYSNLTDFETFIKNSITASKPKSLNHIINMTGTIDTLYSDSIEKYGLGLQGYITKTTNHLKQVNQIVNDINDAYDNISLLYRQLASVFFQMSDESHSFSDQKCYQRLANTYKQVAILTEEHSNFCEIQKDFIDAFLKSHFSYEKIRLENMQGLINKRSTFAYELSKRTNKEQEKGMFGKLSSLFGQKTQYVDTPSANYDTLNNQVGYYNNQLLQESIRCIEVMIESHINHFSSYGLCRIDNVDKMQKIWSNQLVQLSKLGMAK